MTNIDMRRESMYNNRGYRIDLTLKKLTPAGLIKAFFLPKYDKKVPIYTYTAILKDKTVLKINEL